MPIARCLRRLLVPPAILALLACLPVQAAVEPARVVAEAFEESVAALEARHGDIRRDPRVAYELMEEILAPRIDFELMSRLILGRHWSEAQPAQRRAFVEVFRESLLRTYARILAENVEVALGLVRANGTLVRVHSSEGPDSRGRVTVRTRVHLADTELPLDYRLVQRNGEWRVFDVVIENVSFVMNYRSEYDAQVQRHGLDALIARLEERNRRAWSGD